MRPIPRRFRQRAVCPPLTGHRWLRAVRDKQLQRAAMGPPWTGGQITPEWLGELLYGRRADG